MFVYFFFFLVCFQYLFDWDFGNLKRFRGAYRSILKTHCIGGHFRNLALGRNNFKGTNLNFFEKCFWNESQYVCAENKLGENPLEFYLTLKKKKSLVPVTVILQKYSKLSI